MLLLSRLGRVVGSSQTSRQTALVRVTVIDAKSGRLERIRPMWLIEA
jgi:hypothetical protein